MTKSRVTCTFIAGLFFFGLLDTNAQYASFAHQQQNREFIYYSPAELPANAPLLIVLHGYSSDAATIQEYTHFNEIARKMGFAVCYPRGTIDNRGNRFWNVGYDFHPGEDVNDVDFILQLTAFLQGQYNLSKGNTFVTGMSNGGEMCYLLACVAPGTFKAVAPVAGMMLNHFFTSCQISEAIPIFEIHGTRDNVNRYAGDPEGLDGWGAYPDIPTTISFWVDKNGCTSSKVDTLVNSNVSDGSTVVVEKHTNCNRDAQVWFYRVLNGGHDWPGSSGNMDINASWEIWEFFKVFLE